VRLGDPVEISTFTDISKIVDNSKLYDFIDGG